MLVVSVFNIIAKEKRTAKKKAPPSLSEYFQITRKPNGSADQIEFEDPIKWPKEIINLLPKSKDERILAKEEVNKLVRKYHLKEVTKTNPQLEFRTGDSSHWFEQEKPKYELELQFLSRWVVLLAADESKAKINEQGDLSYFANQVYRKLMDKAEQLWKNNKK